MNNFEKGALLLGAAGLGVWLATRERRRITYLLRDKVVLLTGGSRGLGLAMARELAAQGARVALCARDADELERAAEDVAHHGERPLTLSCDVADPERARAVVDHVNQRLGPIDVLINNAGVISVGPMETMTRRDYELNMDVHFWGPFNTIDAVDRKSVV